MAFPRAYGVSFTGTTASMEWEGVVQAASVMQAAVLAAVRARDEGVIFTTETRVNVIKV